MPVFLVQLRCGSLSITTPVSLLVNEFDVPSVLHRQVSLAAVNQIFVVHKTMNGCRKSKDSLMAWFENVNINLFVIWQTVMWHFIRVYTVC